MKALRITLFPQVFVVVLLVSLTALNLTLFNIVRLNPFGDVISGYQWKGKGQQSRSKPA